MFLLGGIPNGLNLAAKRGSNEMTASHWSKPRTKEKI